MSPVTVPPVQDEKAPTVMAVEDTASDPMSKRDSKKRKKRDSEVTNEANMEASIIIHVHYVMVCDVLTHNAACQSGR